MIFIIIDLLMLYFRAITISNHGHATIQIWL